MSIAENHGGLYGNLRLLRETKGKAENNIFKALGLDYVYVENGHDLKALIETFEKVKDIDYPIVVHMHTIKGNGYNHAIENKEAFHWTMPFDLKTGKVKIDLSGESYQKIFGNFLVESARADKSVVGITAGTPGFLGGGVLRTPEFKDQAVAVRIPNSSVVSTGEEVEADFSKVSYKKVAEGNKVAIIGLGHFLSLGEDVKALLKEEMGIDATLINPRFITGLDEEMLNGLLKNHELIVTLEDGSLDGGFGEKIDRFYADKNIKVLNFGAKKEFTDIILSKDLYVRYHLTKELIVEDIKKSLK